MSRGYGFSTRFQLPVEGVTHLYLIRHGQTEANVRHQLAGHTDVPLDTLGESQARQVGVRMSQVGLQAIVSSPLLRARRTADAVASHHRLTPREDARLKEIHFGHVEGLTISQAAATFPEIMTLDEDPDNVEFAWPGGDRRIDFHARVFGAFGEVATSHLNQQIAVVAHGGVITSIIAQLEGGSPNDFERYAIANCSVTHIEVTQQGSMLHLINDYSHLDVVHTEPYSYTDPATLIDDHQESAP